MTTLPQLLAAGLAFGLALFVLFREQGPVVRPLLGAALLLLAVQQLLALWVLSDPLLPAARFPWTVAAAWLPGAWLLVSLTYGRAEPRLFLKRWRLVIACAFLVPLLIALVPLGDFFEDLPVYAEQGAGGGAAEAVGGAAFTGWIWLLGTRGYIFFIAAILVYTLVLANLERTLRNSFGRVRWQVKFAVLGLGGFVAVTIYTSSEAVLFHIWSASSLSVQAWALVAALPLVAIALRRSRTLELEIYLSQKILEGSVAVVAVGVFLLGVGLAVQLLSWLDWPLEIRTVLVFVAALVAAVFLLSDRARDSLRTTTRRHFRRPTHDYRQIWTLFNRETTNRRDERDFGRPFVRIISRSLDCLSVSLWAIDDRKKGLDLLASSAVKEDEARRLDLEWLLERARDAEGVEDLVPQEGFAAQGSRSHVPRPESLELERSDRLEARDESVPGFFAPKSGDPRPEPPLANRTRDSLAVLLNLMTTGPERSDDRPWYLVPLRAGGELLGVLLVGERVRWRPLSWEDRELLQVLADQSASVLRDIRTSRRLKEATERAAFQNMSAFFLHDLKNLANRLSLTVQNLPRHFDNQEFREEAFRTIGLSVEKIKGMCSKLALLREEIELELAVTEFCDFARTTVERLRDEMGVALFFEPKPVGQVLLDRKQFKKVIVNLVLNALDATAARGNAGGGNPASHRPIVVRSLRDGHWAVLEISDEGCGMDEEFVREKLFHPFQTTKPQGMGIGLFQSKMIVDAHGGRIDVESIPERGTTFRILVPTTQ